MTDQQHPITPPPDLVAMWVDLLESRSDETVFNLAAQWGYKQAVEELETFLRKTVDTIHNDSMTTQINGDKLFVIDPHPAIPPSDQLKKWENKWFDEEEHPDVLLIQAFQAGADQELKACCEWFKKEGWNPCHPEALHAARRPKPPSLKEQALLAIDTAVADDRLSPDVANVVRRALEQLDD